MAATESGSPQANETPAVPSSASILDSKPIRPLFAAETPHWNPTNVRPSPANRLQTVRATAGASLSGIASATAIEKSPPDNGMKVSPLVRSATLTRLPPIDSLANDAVPSPPLPTAGTPAMSVSTRHIGLPAAAQADPAVQRASTSESENKAEPQRSHGKVPFSQRTIPGAQFGTGVVKSVRLKEGVAYLEFSSNAAVPPGSVIRAYHEYAITGKTPICDLEVIRDDGGVAAAIARPGSELMNLAIGDRAIVLR
jgi:hypothetical protein